MRVARLGLVCIVVCLLVAGLSQHPPHARAQGERCADDYGVPGACRIFRFQGNAGITHPVQLDFAAYTASTTDRANVVFDAIVARLPSDKMAVTSHLPGARHETYYASDKSNGSVYTYLFRSEKTVAVWQMRGRLENLLGNTTLSEIYDRLEPRKTDGPFGRTMQYLPALDLLPSGYKLTSEAFYGGLQAPKPAATPAVPTSTATQTPNYEATIAALQTEVASAAGAKAESPAIPTTAPSIAPTNTPTSTPTKTPTRIPTATSTRLPDAIDSYVRADSATTCDEIGWSMPIKTDDLTESQIQHHAACAGQKVTVAHCEYLTASMVSSFWAPSPSEKWIVCYVAVFNVGSSTTSVNALDFALVSSSNTRYSSSFEPLINAMSNALSFEMLPAGQNVSGLIAFVVPSSFSAPARLEMADSFSFSSTSTAVIILDSIPPMK